MGQSEKGMKTISNQFIFALLALFSLISLSLAFHHHDVPPQLVSCAICKAKTTTAIAQVKPILDWGDIDISKVFPPTLLLVCPGLVVILFKFHPPSVWPFAVSNRAPPIFYLP
jgi:hypothetical protein